MIVLHESNSNHWHREIIEVYPLVKLALHLKPSGVVSSRPQYNSKCCRVSCRNKRNTDMITLSYDEKKDYIT